MYTTDLNTRLWFSNTSFLMFANSKYRELELIFLHYGTRYETIGFAFGVRINATTNNNN